MGHLEHVSLGEAESSGSAEPETHAPAQRRGGLEKHANGGLAQVPPTRALTGFTQSDGQNWLNRCIPMARTERHPDDITHQLLRAIGLLLMLSVAGVLALVVVKPASYWEGVAGGAERAPVPCVKDTSMEM